jgi:hypothetical protein
VAKIDWNATYPLFHQPDREPDRPWANLERVRCGDRPRSVQPVQPLSTLGGLYLVRDPEPDHQEFRAELVDIPQHGVAMLLLSVGEES